MVSFGHSLDLFVSVQSEEFLLLWLQLSAVPQLHCFFNARGDVVDNKWLAHCPV